MTQERKRVTFKSRVDDEKGTRHRVFFADGMLRVRDATGRAIPLVPCTVSNAVTQTDMDIKHILGTMLQLFRQRQVELVLCRPGARIAHPSPSRGQRHRLSVGG